MRYRRIGASGLVVSRVCLGGMSFGDPARGSHAWTLDEQASRALIEAALSAGINFIDTANAYSDGHSEEIIGRAVRDLATREEVVIATKIFGRMHAGPNGGGLSRGAVLTQVDACLRRLGTDYIDLLQIHRLDPGVRMEETLEALHDVVRAGKARYLGASSMPAWRFSQALHLADVNGWTRFISMQGHWNLLYREEEREMVPLCVDQGIGYLPWSPLARGRLARPWGSTSARTESDRFGAGLYVDADQAIVEAVGREADGLGVPRSQVALAWLLQRPAVSSIIVGLTKPRQLNDALVALDLELTATTLTALDEAYRPRAVAGYE